MGTQDGTLDITDLVETMRSSFVAWAVTYALTAVVAVPGFQWVGLPVVNLFFKAIVRWIANILTKSAVMEAFFLNTAIRKGAQAKDYIEAVKAKNNLPTTASDDEYEKAERAEILAFNNFVRVTN